jgi:hypothetical protein
MRARRITNVTLWRGITLKEWFIPKEPDVGWDKYWERVFIGKELIQIVKEECKNLVWLNFQTVWMEYDT